MVEPLLDGVRYFREGDQPAAAGEELRPIARPKLGPRWSLVTNDRRQEKARALVNGGMSQVEAAEALGVSKQTISRDVAERNGQEGAMKNPPRTPRAPRAVHCERWSRMAVKCQSAEELGEKLETALPPREAARRDCDRAHRCRRARARTAARAGLMRRRRHHPLSASAGKNSIQIATPHNVTSQAIEIQTSTSSRFIRMAA